MFIRFSNSSEHSEILGPFEDVLVTLEEILVYDALSGSKQLAQKEVGGWLFGVKHYSRFSVSPDKTTASLSRK